MSISLSKKRLCEIVKGAALSSESDDTRISFVGVQFDSREIRGGELFFALDGATTHGHQYVDQVLVSGAALVVVEDGSLFSASPHRDRIVVVPNSLDAFSDLARWWRNELNLPLFAITGSVGKTTVKEIAAHLLLGVGPGAYSKKSFNNHVGLPYTLCGMTREHQWAVVEMGMSHAGEIARITRIAEPNHVGITCIAPAHLENFHSLDEIAAAKFEITQGLRPGGTVVLNHSDACLGRGREVLDPKHRLPVSYFGDDPQCQAQVVGIRSFGLEGIGFTLVLRHGPPGSAQVEERAEVKMEILGTQNAYNAACAALIARLLAPQITVDQISKRLASFVAPAMRMNCRQIAEGRWIIDDSYNANPASMGAFLGVARDLSAAGQKVALVIGDMLEMGHRAEELHKEMSAQVKAASPVAVAAVGPLSKHYLERLEGTTANQAATPSLHTLTPEAAADWVLTQPHSILMVKGSRGIQLDQAVRMINTRLGKAVSGKD